MKTRKLKRLLLPGIAVCVLAAVPLIVSASTIMPAYDWYTEDPNAAVFTLDNRADFAGFANIVNGTADVSDVDVNGDGIADAPEDFSGQVVMLRDDFPDTFVYHTVDPIGGQNDTVFNGIFDGNGQTIDDISIDTTDITKNIGLFGHAGPDSVIKNLIIGANASLTKTLTSADAIAIENVGLLAGYSEGRIENCTNNGDVRIHHAVNQSRELVFPVRNIGGLAGQVLRNIDRCVNNGTVSVTENGVPYKAAVGEVWPEETTVVMLNVGGVVGCAGREDTSTGGEHDGLHGTVTACLNTGVIEIDTPNQNGFDRFGNQLYTNSGNIGGVLGYSRGSVLKTNNSGYVNAPNGMAVGGIVGGLRNATEKSMSNMSGGGGDDGTKSKEPLDVTECFNSGSVHGHAVVGGIIGRAGAYTTIQACLNEAETFIVGTRPTKPFPAGIVGITYGTVAYCANFGTVSSGAFDGDKLTRTGAGYYAAGIAGGTHYWKDEDTLMRNSPIPEVYGCYNAGWVLGNGNCRQRHIVGNHDGYCHDNIAVKGLCPGGGDKMVYGEDPGDSESSGISSGNALVSEAQLKNNEVIDETTQATALTALNLSGDKDGWVYYWARPSGDINGGYPVLNTQAQGNTDISSATVSLAANAPYTGLDSVPKANVFFGDVELVQGIDFKVVPEQGATELTGQGQHPYTARIVAIGSVYTGTAIAPLAYGIDAGDLSDCAVLIDMMPFTWEARTLPAENVHVYNLAGDEIDAAEYSFALDENDPHLSDLGDGRKGAVNAEDYDVIVTASENSGHFTGSVTGQFSISEVKILWEQADQDEDRGDSINAHPQTISYAGQDYDWESSTLTPDAQDSELLTFEYTGYPIKPEITLVTYKGRALESGDIQQGDYFAVYGETMAGVGPVADNTGEKDGAGYGYITAAHVPGGNFSNQDNMQFRVVDTPAKNPITGADIRGDEDIIFEPGSTYTPIEVWYGGSKLMENVDYQIEYADNDKLGDASYTVNGIGANFEGTLNGSFNIIEGLSYALTYDYDEDAKTARLTGGTYHGSNAAFEMVIPETTEQDGQMYTVTSIAEYAFGHSNSSKISAAGPKIAKVVIPKTVKSIGMYAFGVALDTSYFTQLQDVVFAEGSMLESIGASAFQGTGITEIVIPKNVGVIANSAFKDCVDLEKVTFLSAEAGNPSIPSTSSASTSFARVSGVAAYGYDEATGIRDFIQNHYGSSLNWTWTSLGAAPTESETGAPGSGDYDGDGYATGNEAIIALRASIGLVSLTEPQFAALDIDRDGYMTGSDSINVLRLSIGLPPIGI